MSQAEAEAQSNSVENANNEESPSSNTPFVVKRLVGQREKLREENGSLNDENSDLATEVARLTQENEQLKTQGNNSQQTNLPPDPDDFENREDYRRASATYTAQVAQNAVGQVLNTQAEGQKQVQFDARVDDHYQQAQKMGKEDYEQAELNTINELGQDFVNGIVANSENSAEILYMLGNSSDEIKKIKSLIQTNPVKATMEIGRLSAKAGGFSKENIPAPETVLSHGEEPNVNHGNLQKEYDKAVAKAADTGDSKGLREIRKKMREAGLI